MIADFDKLKFLEMHVSHLDSGPGSSHWIYTNWRNSYLTIPVSPAKTVATTAKKLNDKGLNKISGDTESGFFIASLLNSLQ